MEPSIRFCMSEDGTQLAYATLGQGRPLLHVPGFSTNVELEWKDPEARSWMEGVAADRLLVRTEHRGVGGSQRDVGDVSLRRQVEDLSAVVEHARLGELDVFAAYDGVATAIAYAAENPERVSRLVLWGAFTRGTDVGAEASYRALADLARQSWRLFQRAWADLCFPSGPTERQRWYADLVRRSVAADVAALYIELMRDIDVTSTVRELKSPALVLHRAGDRYVPVSAGRAVAALLPDATFVPLEGDIGLPVVGDHSYMARVKEFLDRGRNSPGQQPGSGTAIILFTDIADSTKLTERMGDRAFRDASRALDEEMRRVISRSGGTAIEGKLLGDGVMAVFASAARAIDAARGCIDASAACGLTLHVGLHAGDVIQEGDNVYGGAVNIAARVCALSEPGQILVSATVRDLARTSAGVGFTDQGEHSLKGIEDAVRVFAVQRPA